MHKRIPWIAAVDRLARGLPVYMKTREDGEYAPLNDSDSEHLPRMHDCLFYAPVIEAAPTSGQDGTMPIYQKITPQQARQRKTDGLETYVRHPIECPEYRLVDSLDQIGTLCQVGYGFYEPITDTAPPPDTWRAVLVVAAQLGDSANFSDDELRVKVRREDLAGTIVVLRGTQGKHQYQFILPVGTCSTFADYVDCIGRMRALELALQGTDCIPSPGGCFTK